MLTFVSYRDVIRHRIKENTKIRGYQAKMARSAGVSSSYFSQVLRGSVNLTSDQAFAISEFWQLDELEADYFLTLVSMERCGSPRLRERYARSLEKIRLAGYRMTGVERKMFKNDDIHLSENEAIFLFSQWQFMGVREALNVDGLNTAPLIAKHLQIPEGMVASILEKLNEMKLAEVEDGRWSPTPGNVNTSGNPFINRTFHQTCRLKAMQNFAAGLKSEGNISYVGAVSNEEYENFRIAIKNFVLSNLPVPTLGGKKDRVMCFCLDVFRF